MTPLLEKKEFIEIYAHEHGLLNSEAMDQMCATLQRYLQEQKPFLHPIKCELMPKDGTILVRFAYKTETSDETPLLTLAQQLDPEKKFSAWDASNPLRYKTVTVALCVVDINEMSKEKLVLIQAVLDRASDKLSAFQDFPIEQFQFISEYDKRTWSLNHISMYAAITPDMICTL